MIFERLKFIEAVGSPPPCPIKRKEREIDMGDGLLKLVNPEIVEVYGEQACVEAFLSFPGRVGQTVRPQCVTIRARNEKGEEVLYTGKGDLAKCFCHELDHLDGIVLPDRVTAWLSGGKA